MPLCKIKFTYDVLLIPKVSNHHSKPPSHHRFLASWSSGMSTELWSSSKCSPHYSILFAVVVSVPTHTAQLAQGLVCFLWGAEKWYRDVLLYKNKYNTNSLLPTGKLSWGLQGTSVHCPVQHGDHSIALYPMIQKQKASS